MTLASGIVARGGAMKILPVAGGGRGSDLAVVPEIDHRIGEGLERVVQPTDAFEAKQQPAELVLPSKYPLDRAEALLEDDRLEDRLAAPLGRLSAARVGVDVGNHAAVEDRLAVDPAVVDTIKTDDGAAEIYSDLADDAHHLGQGRPQQRRFIAIARRRHERRDHVAPAIAEGDHLVALDLLVAAEAEVIATLFRRRCRAVAMDDRRIETTVLMKLQH